MRDKKIFVTLLLITTVMSFTCGCGRQAEPVNAELTGPVEEADTEESTGKSIEENAKPTSSPAAALKESTESSEAEDNSEREVDATEEPVPNENPVAAEKPAQTEKPATAETPAAPEEPAAAEKPVQNTQAKTEQQSAPAASESAQTAPAQTTSAQNREPAQSDNGVAPAPTPAPTPTPVPTPAPTPVPQPVHEHVWKEHTATTQTWIPNIVVVEDYETQYVVIGEHYRCSCGFETDDADVISEHYKAGYIAGTCINFGIQSRYGEQQVLVGTHEEDQGHYETSTYVDYYYCDCGATK